jgi:hypothetical protein
MRQRWVGSLTSSRTVAPMHSVFPQPAALDLRVAGSVDHEVRAEAALIQARIGQRRPEPRKRGGGDEVHRAAVEVRDFVFARKRHGRAQRVGKRRVNLRVAAEHALAVGNVISGTSPRYAARKSSSPSIWRKRRVVLPLPSLRCAS